MDVVEVLAGIVEQRGVGAEAGLHDFFERLVGHARSFGQLVAFGHIGLMVLVVVKLKRFSRHVGAKGVIGVGKVRQFKSHGTSPRIGGCNQERPSAAAGLEPVLKAERAGDNRFPPKADRFGSPLADHRADGLEGFCLGIAGPFKGDHLAGDRHHTGMGEPR
jgi:hypothetical protein